MGSTKSSEIVDVPVGIVARKTRFSQITCAAPRKSHRYCSMSCFREPGIPVGVQQALFRGQHCAASVHVDGAAFQNDPRHEKANAEPLADEVRDIAVLEQTGYFPPQALNRHWTIAILPVRLTTKVGP